MIATIVLESGRTVKAECASAISCAPLGLCVIALCDTNVQLKLGGNKVVAVPIADVIQFIQLQGIYYANPDVHEPNEPQDL